MDQIVLLKIESLHARIVHEGGIKLRYKRRDLFTGSIAAVLDETAAPPANLGLLNLTSGAIRLQWSILVTMPFLADAVAGGQVSEKERGLLRITFDESGKMLPNDSGFDATGGGSIGPGSFLSGAKIFFQSNFIRTPPAPGKMPCCKTLASGKSVPCALLPESYLDVLLPASLGGGEHRLNLTGGFVLVPIMTLDARATSKKTRR
jgi:hypothetical protein